MRMVMMGAFNIFWVVILELGGVKAFTHHSSNNLATLKKLRQRGAAADTNTVLLLAEETTPVSSFIEKLPNPFEALKAPKVNSEPLLGEQFEPTPDGLIRQAKRVLASDLGLQDPSLLDDTRFKWIGPTVDKPLSKIDYLAAGRFFDLRAAFPDFDFRPHDFRVDEEDETTVWVTCRVTGTMRGELRLRNEILQPTGKTMNCPPEAITISFDLDTGKVVKICSGFAMDRLVGNTAGTTGVRAASTIAGKPVSDWEIYPPTTVVRRFFGRPVQQLPQATSFLAPFPETVMIQLAKGILATNMAYEDPTLLAKDFTYCTPFIGPIRKADFLEKHAKVEFEGVDPNFSHFRVDPYDPVRVWVDVQPSSPAGYQGAPQAMSFTFDDDGFCKRITSQAVMDPTTGNGGGLGGPEGYKYAIGQASPAVTTRPLPRSLGRLRKRVVGVFTGTGPDDYELPGTVVARSPEPAIIRPPKPPVERPPPAFESLSTLRAKAAEATKVAKADLQIEEDKLRLRQEEAARKKQAAEMKERARREQEAARQKEAKRKQQEQAKQKAEQMKQRAEVERKRRDALSQKATGAEARRKQQDSQKADAERKPKEALAKKAKEAEARRKQQQVQKAEAERKRQEAQATRAAAAEERRQRLAAEKADAERKRKEALAKKAEEAEARRKQQEIQKAEAERKRQEAQAMRAAAAEERRQRLAEKAGAERTRKEAAAAAAAEKKQKEEQRQKELKARKEAQARARREEAEAKRQALEAKRKEDQDKKSAKAAAAAKANKAEADQKQREKAALEVLSQAASRATITLFGLGGTSDEGDGEERSSLPKAGRSKPSKKAPPGVPVIRKWRKNFDGSVTGRISGSRNFAEGEQVTTSPVAKGKIAAGEVVKTGSGSRYFLS